MNELLLSLVASPGGNEAITGVMAKAPPGESPPVTAASFLQVLLQTMPAGQVLCPSPLLLGGWSAEPAQASQEVKGDEAGAAPAGDGDAPVEPGIPAMSLPALGLAALAVVLPTAALPDIQVSTQTAESGPGVAPATPALSGMTALAGQTVPAGAESPPETTPGQAFVLQTLATKPGEEPPPKLTAEIPAPETREGSAKTEDPGAPQKQAAGMAEQELSEGGVHAKSSPEVPREPVFVADSGAPNEQKAPRPGISRSHDLPVNTAATEDRPDVRPSVLSSKQGLRPADAKVGGAKADPLAAAVEVSVREAFLERLVHAVPEDKQVPEDPSARLTETRRADREQMPAADARHVQLGKPVERAIVVELPVMPALDEKAKKPVPAAEPAEEKSASAQATAADTGAGKVQPASTGGAQQVRESAEPIAARHTLVGIQGPPSKETGEGAATKDPLSAAARMHFKLTEELSRSVLDQVVKHVTLQVRGEMSEMRIRLDPPLLGEIHVTVRVDEGRVQAQIDVTQPSVRVALESSVPQLRQNLADHGIEVHRIDVCASGSSMSHESREGRGHHARKRDGGRQQGSLDGVDQYRGARMMGYNTIEMVM